MPPNRSKKNASRKKNKSKPRAKLANTDNSDSDLERGAEGLALKDSDDTTDAQPGPTNLEDAATLECNEQVTNREPLPDAHQIPDEASALPELSEEMSKAIALYDFRQRTSSNISSSLRYPPRPGFGTTGHEVLTNHFKINLEHFKRPKEDECCLFVYRIDGIEPKHTRAKKKTLLEAAVEACHGLNQSQGLWVTDNMSKFVSWRNLAQFYRNIPKTPEDDIVIDTFDVIDYNKRTYENSTITLRLTFERKINLTDLENYAKGVNPRYPYKQEAIAASNLFFTKHLLAPDQPNFQLGKSRFFLKKGHEQIDSYGKLAYRGYSFQVRPTMGQLVLNLNTSTGLLYKNVTVADYLHNNNDHDDLVGLRVWLKLKRNVGGDTPNLDSEQVRTKTIYAIGGRADEEKAYALTENGVEIDVTVWGHMSQNYEGHPNMNYNTAGNENSTCINTNPTAAATKTWFLAEDLVILPGQMYKRKLDSHLTSEIIKKACRKPEVNVKAILKEGLEAMGGKLDQTKKERPQPFLEFGISLDPRMLKVPARLIETPKIEFIMFDGRTNQSKAKAVSIVQDNGHSRGTWHLKPDWAFLTTSQALTGKPFFLIPPNFPVRGLQHFWTYYTKHGAPAIGDLPNQFNGTNSRSIYQLDDIRKGVEAASKAKPSIVIMILPDKNKKYLGQYAAFKALVDREYGLPSLCLSSDKLKDRNQRSVKADFGPTSNIANYAYSVGMKLNIRFGNTNHSVEDINFQMLPRDANDNHDTLILGADVIHPGASRIKGTPSIAALVGSVDNKYGKYLGSMRMQPYDPKAESKEIIVDDNMRAMACERLEAWKNANGRYPGNILYYRDGVGDSQFDQVLDNEVAMIRKAYKDGVQGTSQQDSKPNITAVVVVKRHNVRLYPTAPKNTSNKDNCLPGIVVDSGITHPYNFDFFLVSHDALQGTARPTHYIVLLNEMQFDATNMQDLTHNLCYTYQRSTTSVSYVPPAYYADHLCERGRCYLMDFYDGAASVYDEDPKVVEQYARKVWAKGGRGNPWHPNMDDKMFWM